MRYGDVILKKKEVLIWFILTLYFFWVDWKIGILCLVFMICMTFTAFLFYPRLQKLRIREYKARGLLNDSVYDRMGTLLKTISSNGQVKEELHFTAQELVHRKAEEDLRQVLLEPDDGLNVEVVGCDLVFFSFLSYITSLKFNFIEPMNDYSILNEHNKQSLSNQSNQSNYNVPLMDI